MTDDDFIVLIDDEAAVEAADPLLPPWKVAVIDDDPAVHDGTRFALQGYTLAGRRLELLTAHSGAEGRELLRAHPDTAVVLLDVVMETDGAGLDLVTYIRRDLGNHMVRIILRTGQPGQAPEQRIIVDYDINDYKAKTELTADKFFTALTVALRSFSLYQQLHEANIRLEERVAQRTLELTAANERLHGQWTRLRTIDAFKSEVLGTVAHDLKNPLGVILGRTEMLTEMLAMPAIPLPQAGAQIEHIRKAVRGLTGMVDSLIADAMADALDITVQRRPFDLSALAADVAEANRALAERKQQALAFAGADELVVAGDQDRLREAIDNLVSNAVKYTPPGGNILVEARLDGQDARVAVRDSGPGLSPEDGERLFGRFQRLSAKPTGGESSTGLGLSIARRIVELHGGRIEVEAPAGGGSLFTIVLPA